MLVLMVLIWAVNYSVMKRAFAEMAPLAFNGLRLSIASGLLLLAIRIARRRASTSRDATAGVFHTPNPVTRRDRWDLCWLGLVGHTGYQLCFATGVSLTTASNGALIIGASPVAVALLSAALGRERIRPLHWIGAAVSALGIYYVVGHGASFGGKTLRGDLLMMAAVACWAIYTVGGTRLMAHHSPLYVTGTTMAIGTVPYVLVAIPALLGVTWSDVGMLTWVSLGLSALLALCVSYLVWYAAVQRLGPSRTAIYSNMIPIAAMSFAALILHEPISRAKIVGAGAVLFGVVLTRLGRKGPPVAVEE